MGPVALFLTPTVVPLRFTKMEQLGLAAGSVPPVKVMVDEPAVAVTVPPQLLVRPLGVATTRPAGKLSVKAIPVRSTLAVGLLRSKPTNTVAFSATALAKSVLVMVGGAATFKVADAVLPVPPLVEVTLPVVLRKLPGVLPVTFTDRVQLLLTAMVPPVSDTLPEPATAVAVPPQVFVNPFGVATTIPAGNVSVNATPFSATVLAAGLVSVMVRVLTPFTGMPAGLNALAMEGGATTVSEAEAVPPGPRSPKCTLRWAWS